MPAGRPTLYRPEYCDDVLEMGDSGWTIAQMARGLGVARDTIYEWARQHEEFSDALARARTHAEAYHTDRGVSAMYSVGSWGGASAWSRMMATQFPHDWRETTVHEHQHSGSVDLRHKTDADLERLIEQLARETGAAGGGAPGASDEGEA